MPQLCALSNPPLSPSDVQEIVPGVTVSQMAAFFDLIQELFGAQEDAAPPAKMPRIAAEADDGTEAPEVASNNDLAETLFEQIKRLASTRYESAREKLC